MAKILDLSTRKKEVFTFIFPDGKTKLFIKTPDKAVFTELMSHHNALTNLGADADTQALDDMYSICARLMSRNQQGITIDPKELEKQIDFEDLLVFFNEYGNFINEIVNAKN